jgi:hypothetical protein
MASVGALVVLFFVSQLPWPEKPAFMGASMPAAEVKLYEVDTLECAGRMEAIEEDIERMLSAGRQCESDAQCEVIGLVCPFGCRDTLNFAAVPEILDALDRYETWGQACGMQCRYRCTAPQAGRAVCESGRCTFQVDTLDLPSLFVTGDEDDEIE